jgi:hypothetical protein
MQWMQSLPPPLAAALKEEAKGEIIHWADQPSPGRAALTTLPILLFAIPWTAISGFMLVMAIAGMIAGKAPGEPGHIGTGLGIFFILFLVPFVGIGLAMLSAPLWAWHTARHTVHAVTDKRLLTIVEGRTRTVKSVLPEHIVTLERKERRDGSGILTVVTGYEKDSDGDTVKLKEDIGPVAGVRQVERHVAAIRGARTK